MSLWGPLSFNVIQCQHSMCMYVQACTCTQHMQRLDFEEWAHSFHCGIWGLNSGQVVKLAWQALLPVELSCCPGLLFFMDKMTGKRGNYLGLMLASWGANICFISLKALAGMIKNGEAMMLCSGHQAVINETRAQFQSSIRGNVLIRITHHGLLTQMSHFQECVDAVTMRCKA